jgi:hypothetical protein
MLAADSCGYITRRGVRMNVWLDDERSKPEGFHVHVKTSQEAIQLLNSKKVALLSLDHDLGPAEAGTGYDVAKWIEQMAFYGVLGRIECRIHSANSVGRKNIAMALENAERYWRRKEDTQKAG